MFLLVHNKFLPNLGSVQCLRPGIPQQPSWFWVSPEVIVRMSARAPVLQGSSSLRDSRPAIVGGWQGSAGHRQEASTLPCGPLPGWCQVSSCGWSDQRMNRAEAATKSHASTLQCWPCPLSGELNCRRAVRATMGLGYHLGQRSHTSLTGNIGILGVLVKWFVMQFKVKFRFLCKMSF